MGEGGGQEEGEAEGRSCQLLRVCRLLLAGLPERTSRADLRLDATKRRPSSINGDQRPSADAAV